MFAPNSGTMGTGKSRGYFQEKWRPELDHYSALTFESGHITPWEGLSQGTNQVKKSAGVTAPNRPLREISGRLIACRNTKTERLASFYQMVTQYFSLPGQKVLNTVWGSHHSLQQ